MHDEGDGKGRRVVAVVAIKKGNLIKTIELANFVQKDGF